MEIIEEPSTENNTTNKPRYVSTSCNNIEVDNILFTFFDFKSQKQY